jgi:uridine kinase
MDIIGLVGASNSGKSSTIKRLFEELKSQNAEIIEESKFDKVKDFWVIIKWNGIIIAIASAGDFATKHVLGHIVQFSHCDVLIMAISVKENKPKTQNYQARELIKAKENLSDYSCGNITIYGHD